MFDPIIPAGDDGNNLYVAISNRNGKRILVIGQEAERFRHSLTVFILPDLSIISDNRDTNFIRIRAVRTVRPFRSYFYFKSLRGPGESREYQTFGSRTAHLPIRSYRQHTFRHRLREPATEQRTVTFPSRMAIFSGREQEAAFTVITD